MDLIRKRLTSFMCCMAANSFSTPKKSGRIIPIETSYDGNHRKLGENLS